MTSDRLVDDPEAIAALSARLALEIGIPAEHIEKDFWVTEVLRGVVIEADRRGVEIVFKGGTSLSKAFSIIKRFSEDVDLLVVFSSEGSPRSRDRILKGLVEGAQNATGVSAVTEPGATSSGKKRGARFHYRSSDYTQLGGLSSGVLLELGSRGGALPTELLTVRSLIAEHASDLIAGAVELEDVEVRVLAPWRTLVEKLVLLHTAHSSADESSAVRSARHYYDVCQLLNSSDVVDGLKRDGVVILARDVCTYSRAADMPAEDRPVGGFAGSPAFGDGSHVASARREYEQRVMPLLLWPQEGMPTFEECLAVVHKHSTIL